MAPRRGRRKALEVSGLAENGTIEDLIRSQCFLPRVSQAQALDETARAAELSLGEVITPFPRLLKKGCASQMYLFALAWPSRYPLPRQRTPQIGS